MKSDYITLGYTGLSDHELAVAATFNIDVVRNVNPELVEEFKQVILNLNHRLQTEIYNRQDVPDVVDISDE